MCTQLFIILLAIEQSVFWGGGVEQALKGHSRDDFAVFWGKKKTFLLTWNCSQSTRKKDQEISPKKNYNQFFAIQSDTKIVDTANLK